MTEEIIILCPEIAPGAGGVADYTLRVVEQWRDRWPVRFLVPETVKRDGRALRKKLPAHGGRVLLQYSAYGFDRLGYPRWLLRELAAWKKSSGGLLVVMFHEIWTFWPVLNKNYLVQQLHRRDIAKLLAAADAVFTSTDSQAEHLRALVPREIEVLPVGSNIRVTEGTDARRPGQAVVFGLEGSRIRTLRQMQADLRSLAAANKITRIISVGGANTERGEEEERELLTALPLSDGFAQRGALPELAVSQLLLESSFGISTQDELSLTKSGTVMAYAAHGLNILSPEIGWLTQPAELVRGIATDELQKRANDLHAWQEQTASWPRIAERFATALQMATPL